MIREQLIEFNSKTNAGEARPLYYIRMGCERILGTFVDKLYSIHHIESRK